MNKIVFLPIIALVNLIILSSDEFSVPVEGNFTEQFTHPIFAYIVVISFLVIMFYLGYSIMRDILRNDE